MEAILMTPFETAICEHMPSLRRYALALTRDVLNADDLVQSTMLLAIKNQHQWKPGTNLTAWLRKILYHRHISEVRKACIRGNLVPLEKVQEKASVEEQADTLTLLRAAERALNTLSSEHKEVLMMITVEGIGYEEVAARLNLPVGTVRSRFGRARQTLRTLLHGVAVGEDRYNGETR